eukprot:TRINITY_DN6372_c0_g1_i1.p1 TRINITY_DN6372_c0_g1~~TRINITY_DN6372_c0_g1_i1.p1  ORF type:complete len:589 (-),score=118.20 TRINITY_DN6372_c0_g1_i1:1054-2820(-)
MDPMGEEELDYEDEDYGQKKQFQTSGAISALAEEEIMPDDEDYDDLYNDVNVGEGFMQIMNVRSNNRVGVENGTEPARDKAEFRENEPDRFSAKDEKENAPVKEKIAVKENASGVVPGETSNLGQYADSSKERAAEKEKVGDVVSKSFGKGSDGGVANQNRGGNQTRAKEGSVSGRHNEGGTTMLFIGELHWWTTDAELEAELEKYGKVKELKFYDEKASGKSKGYCHAEFFEPSAAASCKHGMNGHVFNGRACVVDFASPNTVRQMGAAQMNKNQNQGQNQNPNQHRRMMNDGGSRGAGGSSYQSGGDSGRSFGKMGNWGRSGGGGNRGGQGRSRGGGMGAKSGNSGYGQGLPGPPMGGHPGGMMHPQGMMGQGFDPSYGAHMGRGAYGGFSSHSHFPGMMHPFPPVANVGLPGVAPHVNPAFFGRGVAANGMGMMPNSGMEGQMWGDSSMSGSWVSDEQHGRRMRESSYGEEMGSDYGYGDVGHDRGGRSSGSRERERGSERDWGGSSERRRRDDRDSDWHRDRYRDEKEGYGDRQRDRDWDNADDWEREKLSRGRSKSRMIEDDDQRGRFKDMDYVKRRRLQDHE